MNFNALMLDITKRTKNANEISVPLVLSDKNGNIVSNELLDNLRILANGGTINGKTYVLHGVNASVFQNYLEQLDATTWQNLAAKIDANNIYIDINLWTTKISGTTTATFGNTRVELDINLTTGGVNIHVEGDSSTSPSTIYGEIYLRGSSAR